MTNASTSLSDAERFCRDILPDVSRTFAIKTFRYYAPQAWSEIGEE